VKRLSLAAVLIFNGSPSGTVQLAAYNSHFADVRSKAVAKHIPRGALQRWVYKGAVLIIDTDSLLFSGFE